MTRPSASAPAARRLRPAAVLAVVVVAGLALVVGVVVGQDDGGGGAAPDDRDRAPTVAVAATNDADADAGVGGLEPLPPVSPEPLPPAPRPAFVAWTKGSVAVAAELADLSVEFVGVTENGELVTVDAATGRTTRRESGLSAAADVTIVAEPGWIMMWAPSPVGSLIIHDDGNSAIAPGLGGRPVLAVSGTDLVWSRPARSDPTETVEIVEVSVLSGPTGTSLVSPGEPVAIDPMTGGVVVQAAGGTYTISPTGTGRLTPGRLVGLGSERALVRECEDPSTCGYFVVDRSTSARRMISLDRALGDRTTLESAQWWSLPSPMSPTDDRLLVATWDQFNAGTPSQGILDLDTGAYTAVTHEVVPMEWGPDGEMLFHLDDGRLVAYIVATGETVEVAPELDRLRTVTWRTAEG